MIRSVFITAAFALLLVSGASAQFKLRAPQKPTITYDRVEVKKVTFEKADVEFVYIVDNPNPVGLDFLTMDYELLLQDQSAATGKDMKFTIKAKAKTELRLPLEVVYLHLFKSTQELTKAILGGKKSIPFTINATFKADVKLLKFSIPVTAKGELPLPTSVPGKPSLPKLK